MMLMMMMMSQLPTSVPNNVVEAHGYGFRSTVVKVSIHAAKQVQ